MIRFLNVLVGFVMSLTLATALLAQDVSPDVTPTAPSANDLHEFTRLLGDARIQDWIKTQAEEADANGLLASNAPGARELLEATVARTKARINALATALPSLNKAPGEIARAWRAQISPQRQVRSLTLVMIFLFMGAGLEWLVRQYTNPLRRRIELTVFARPMQRVWAAFSRAGLTLLGLLAFGVASIGAFAAFEWPPLVEILVLDALFVIIAVRIFGAGLILLLAPRVPRLRLAPVSTDLARALTRIAFVAFALAAMAVAQMDLFARVFPEQVSLVLAVEVVLGLCIWVVAVLATLIGFRAVHRLSDVAPSISRLWRTYMVLLASLLLVLWLLDVDRLMWTVLLLGLLIPALRLLKGWVDAGFNTLAAEHALRFPVPEPAFEILEDGTEGEAIEVPEPPLDPAAVYRPIVQRLVRFGAVICVGLAVAVLWRVGLFENAENPTVLQQAFSVLLDSAAALLIADLIWVWAKTSIDSKMAAYRPPEDGTAPGPEARMATLLPLLRVVLMVTLLGVVVMSILSSAGVNIAPLLAGASVLGIAIGFGAQSLVRDVVSGIFFLVDDAFRVGEYVEIDQLRGTVEKISIRSLQIRHHRGAVHTLPFGELKSMTNHSRDWVIMKLEFRVPFDTDLKLVKKLIKQVGARLKENPDYGDGIIETLKSQGVRRMEEFNMVVGVKFMTRPGEQWLVRRDAYQFVRDIFDENGIRMAERNVKVEIAGGEELTEEERHAATAAAQEAIQRPAVPGVIPDEP